MRIAICDDEKEIRDMLSVKVKKMYPEDEVSLYTSGDELLNDDRRMDICLLDIRMNGKNGMETAREIRKINKKAVLIFVTAYNDYVFEAFDVGAFNYLLKPFDDEKFEKVMENAAKQYEESGNVTKGREQEYIMVRSGKSSIRVLIEDIVFAEIFNRIIVIHTLNGDIKYYGRLSELEKAAGKDFYRPHRAYLINFKYVVKYDSSVICLEKGQALIARKKYSDFVKQYLRYIKNH